MARIYPSPRLCSELHLEVTAPCQSLLGRQFGPYWPLSPENHAVKFHQHLERAAWAQLAGFWMGPETLLIAIPAVGCLISTSGHLLNQHVRDPGSSSWLYYLLAQPRNEFWPLPLCRDL